LNTIVVYHCIRRHCITMLGFYSVCLAVISTFIACNYACGFNRRRSVSILRS